MSISDRCVYEKEALLNGDDERVRFGETHSFANERSVGVRLGNDILYVAFRVSLQFFQIYQKNTYKFYNLCNLSFGGLYRVTDFIR